MVEEQLERVDEVLENKPPDVPVNRLKKHDPLMVFLWLLLAALIVGGLLTVLSALLFGFVDLNHAPTTREERDAIVAEGVLAEGGVTAAQWQDSIMGLLQAGRRTQAEVEFARLKAAIESGEVTDADRGDTVSFLNGAFAQDLEKYDEAIGYFETTLKNAREAYEYQRDFGATDKNWALAYGIDRNYSYARLMLAGIYAHKQEWAKAVENLDSYLELNPTEAGVWIDLGNAKLELKDFAGAKTAFENALKYMPDDAEARAGLEAAQAGL